MCHGTSVPESEDDNGCGDLAAPSPNALAPISEAAAPSRPAAGLAGGRGGPAGRAASGPCSCAGSPSTCRRPPHLRNRLLPTLPWRALAAIAADASAHPQARAHAVERLRSRWAVMTMGERRSLAPLAPALLWPAIWKVRDGRVLAAFLQNPRLTWPAWRAWSSRELTLSPGGGPAGLPLAGDACRWPTRCCRPWTGAWPGRIPAWCWAWRPPGSWPCRPRSGCWPPPASPTRPCGG